MSRGVRALARWSVFFVQLFCLAFIASVIAGVVLIVTVTERHRQEAIAAKPCVRGVAVVRVQPADVAYARAQGWTPVLRRGGDPLLGDVVAFDRSPTAIRVLRRTARFCHGQRYRLVAQ